MFLRTTPFVIHILSCDPRIKVGMIETMLHVEVEGVVKFKIFLYQTFADVQQFLKIPLSKDNLHIVVIDHGSPEMVPYFKERQSDSDPFMDLIIELARRNASYIIAVTPNPVIAEGAMTKIEQTNGNAYVCMMDSTKYPASEEKKRVERWSAPGMPKPKPSRYNWTKLILEAVKYVDLNRLKLAKVALMERRLLLSPEPVTIPIHCR